MSETRYLIRKYIDIHVDTMDEAVVLREVRMRIQEMLRDRQLVLARGDSRRFDDPEPLMQITIQIHEEKPAPNVYAVTKVDI